MNYKKWTKWTTCLWLMLSMVSYFASGICVVHAQEEAPPLTISSKLTNNGFVLNETVNYQKLDTSKTYILTSKLIDVATKKVVVTDKRTNLQADSTGNGSWEIELNLGRKVKGGQTYDVEFQIRSTDGAVNMSAKGTPLKVNDYFGYDVKVDYDQQNWQTFGVTYPALALMHSYDLNGEKQEFAEVVYCFNMPYSYPETIQTEKKVKYERYTLEEVQAQNLKYWATKPLSQEDIDKIMRIIYYTTAKKKELVQTYYLDRNVKDKDAEENIDADIDYTVDLKNKWVKPNGEENEKLVDLKTNARLYRIAQYAIWHVTDGLDFDKNGYVSESFRNNEAVKHLQGYDEGNPNKQFLKSYAFDDVIVRSVAQKAGIPMEDNSDEEESSGGIFGGLTGGIFGGGFGGNIVGGIVDGAKDKLQEELYKKISTQTGMDISGVKEVELYHFLIGNAQVAGVNENNKVDLGAVPKDRVLNLYLSDDANGTTYDDMLGKEVPYQNLLSASFILPQMPEQPEDEEKKFKFSKQDLNGHELPGAKLQIKKGSEVIESWTSTKEPHEFALESGKYLLHEEVAPNGFLKVTEVPFEVDETGHLMTTASSKIAKVNEDQFILMNEAARIRTTVAANAQASNHEAAATVQALDAKLGVVVTDTITYQGLVADKVYQVIGQLMEVDGNQVRPVKNDEQLVEVQQLFTAQATDAQTSKDFTLNFGKINLQPGKRYVVYETVTSVDNLVDTDGDGVLEKHQLEHKDATDLAQTLVVKQALYENPKAGTLRTTAKVNGNTTSNPVTVPADHANGVVVQDTIDYTDLVGGKSYQVTGTLMHVTKDHTVEKVTTKTNTFTADTSGKGQWTLTFDAQNLIAGEKYVVYEVAESVENLVDTNSDQVADEKHVIRHEDQNDQAQTVVIEKATYENPKAGTLRTTAKVNGNTTSNPVTVPADHANGVVVQDTIDYTDLVGGKSYQVTGILMHVKNDHTVEAVTTKTNTFTADTSGKGQWTLTFDAQNLVAGEKYVVYEVAESVENLVDTNSDQVADEKHVIRHEDQNDQAQTVVVEKATEPTEPETTQYKEVIFSKQNVDGEEIAGAKIQIKQNGKVVSEWTSEKGQSHVIKLLPGTYTFHEEAAPNGYLKVTDFEFTIDESGKVSLTGKVSDASLVNGKLVIVDQRKEIIPPTPTPEPMPEPTPTEPQPKEITFSKQNVDGEEIAGAKIQIKQNGKVISEWTSKQGQSHVIKLLPGTYTFHEEAAPNGYLKVTDFEFTIDENGKVTVKEGQKDAKIVDGKLVVIDQRKEKTPKDELKKERKQKLPKSGTQAIHPMAGLAMILIGLSVFGVNIRFLKN